MFTQVKPLGNGTEELRLRCNMYCPCRNCGDLAILLILHRLATKIGIQLKKKVQASAIYNSTHAVQLPQKEF